MIKQCFRTGCRLFFYVFNPILLLWLLLYRAKFQGCQLKFDKSNFRAYNICNKYKKGNRVNLSTIQKNHKLMNVKSQIILRNLVAFICKALKSRDCNLQNINTYLFCFSLLYFCMYIFFKSKDHCINRTLY